MMAKEVFRRAEKKFMLDDHQYHTLRTALSGHMLQDSYSAGGGYSICNLYMDTPDHYYIRQSLAKPKYKEKLRLRGYGTPEPGGRAYLELKKKFDGTVHKRRCGLELQDAYRFLQGQPLLGDRQSNPQVLREIEAMMTTRTLLPRLYLSYDRIALYSPREPGLRITFDHNLTTRRHDLRLESGSYGVPLLREGLWLMEVKAEQGLPIWLVQIFDELDIYPTSFSKYGAEYQRYLYTQLQKGGSERCLKPSLTAWLMPLSPSDLRSWAS